MEILVNLGFRWAMRLDGWEEKYRNKEVFDKLPYGYCWAESEQSQITYMQLSNIEKRIFFNSNKLLKIYFYLIKTPIVSMKYDIIWTHNDRDGLFYGFLKSIPIINKHIPRIIANIIWLTDRELTDKQIKRYIKYLRNIDKITILSRAQESILEKKFKVKKDKISFVTYGLNKNIYSDTSYISEPKNLNVKNEYILMVGTDIHRDIDLFKSLTEKLPNEKFIFATNNPLYLNQNYSSNVQVIKCNLKEMKYLYQKSKFLIMPLRKNTHASGCTTLIETGLQKKAIITNWIDGLDDYFIKNKTVELVEENTEKAYIKSIKKLNNKEYREKIEKNAYEYFSHEKKYRSIEYAKSFLKLSQNIKNEI